MWKLKYFVVVKYVVLSYIIYVIFVVKKYVLKKFDKICMGVCKCISFFFLIYMKFWYNMSSLYNCGGEMYEKREEFILGMD